ncbi:aldolase [Sphingobium algorifonticola]|uniref:Aldolase n=2 Tax=Sphingobium algorifonticola TaxID=2008318 RepID=A0A437JDI3_9SPHN|nr:aldolase [Sphingobium algorifonticola]
MFNSHKPRINRFLAADGKCLDVAIDHGIFNEPSFLDGLQDMAGVVDALVKAAPDAIQMNIGQADLLQSVAGPHKPGLVLRTDVGNLYNPVTHAVMYDQLVHYDEPIIGALKADAAAVVVNLLLMPGQPDLHRQSVLNVGRLRAACDRYGMPLMVEPLVLKSNENGGGYQVDGNKRLIVSLVRQARELGADVIKADPTDHADDYHEVVQAARCPVLVRGGGRKPIEQVFAEAAAFLAQGAHGLVYGRNIYQHPNPARIVAAFMAMIHDGADAEKALAIYRDEA